jgi:hypothetical protein
LTARHHLTDAPSSVGPPWKDHDMTETRFVTVVDDLETMLSVVDVDEVGDIETLLMFLFVRPIRVDEVWDDEGAATALEVIVKGNEESVGSAYEFPMSVMELARSCAHTVEELGAYTQDGFALDEVATEVGAMGDAELVGALQEALGKVRIFNMMDDDD